MQHLKSVSLGALLVALVLPASAHAQSTKIAECGPSEGIGYYADRNLAQGADLGWTEMEEFGKRFILVQNAGGTLDFLYPEKEEKYSTYVATGGTLIPIGISENAITIVANKPEFTTSETYIFHKLRDGSPQVIWTRAKAETPLPMVGAAVADCSYLNLSAIEK